MSQRHPRRTILTVSALVLAAVSLVGCSAAVSIDLSTAKPIVPAMSTTAPAATPSESPDSAGTGATNPTDETVVAADPAAFATDSASQIEFLSPDENTRCVIYAADPGTARASLWGCSLYTADWSESAKNCATLDCAVGVEARGDAIPALREHAGRWLWNAKVVTLPSGQSLTVDTVQCTSSETGVTCADAQSGHGFTVAAATHSIW